MYFGKEFGLPYRLIRFLLLSKRDSPLVGESRVPGEKRGDLCGIGGFQKKVFIPNNKQKKAYLREDFSEENHSIPLK